MATIRNNEVIFDDDDQSRTKITKVTQAQTEDENEPYVVQPNYAETAVGVANGCARGCAIMAIMPLLCIGVPVAVVAVPPLVSVVGDMLSRFVF